MMISHFLLQAAPITDSIANAATAVAGSTEVSVTENISYLDFLLKGGIMIYPLIVLLFFCIYVIIERYLSIRKVTKQDTNLISEVKMQLKTGRIDNAIMLCSRENTAS